jgi:hypothetical protein
MRPARPPTPSVRPLGITVPLGQLAFDEGRRTRRLLQQPIRPSAHADRSCACRVSRFDHDEIVSFEGDDIAGEFVGNDVCSGNRARHPRALRRVECAGRLPLHHPECLRAGMSANAEWSLNAHSDKPQASFSQENHFSRGFPEKSGLLPSRGSIFSGV